MIFLNVNNLVNKTQKSFFLEQVEVYCRLIEVFCEKYSYELNNSDSKEYIDEFKKIGVIVSNDELALLKKTLGIDLYNRFVRCVNFKIKNGDAVGDLVDKLSNDKRKKMQKISQEKHSLTLVDFFCGAGGLSLGFLQSGFNVKLANDIEDVCIETYKYNHPELPSEKLIQGDIKQIVDNINDYITEPIDIVVGGPPCQGFSTANRQRVIDDPRNKLYKYFVKAVENICPKFVVMENVKGMLKVADQVVEDYEKLRIKRDNSIYSYKVAYSILNSENFGVAQSRERLIYIAIRNDVMIEKEINPQKIFKIIKEENNGRKKYNLSDALECIKKLDAPRIKNMNEVDDEHTGKKIDVNNFAQNDYLKNINLGRDIPFVFNHKARYVNDINYDIYRLLNQGDDSTDEKIRQIMPYSHRNHCFKDKYYKLIANKPCRTITAHLRMDCHSHIHPTQIRAITPREAARIQSFPDDYLFLGPYLKTYMQIGNAVPTMMARGIANVIKRYL